MLRTVIGTTCDPSLLPTNMIARLRPGLDRDWNEKYPDDTPTEVARHGPSSPEQAALAYCLLRVAARMLPSPEAREANELARQIADDSYEAPAAVGAGPYRESSREARS
jgi:hypothetical protein